MLRKWSVEGFKSIKSAPDIPLRMINVFAGANSSGKSSLLQSILLLKQTLQYGAQNRPLSLNGPILRLGTLDDVLFAGGGVKELSIGFEFDIPPREYISRAPWADVMHRISWASGDAGAIASLRAQFYWSPRSLSSSSTASDRLQAVLTSGSFCIERTAEIDGVTLAYSADYHPKAGADVELYDVDLDPLSKADVLGSKAEADVAGLTLANFLPNWVQIRFNASRQKAQEVAEQLFRPRVIGRAHGVAKEVLTPSALKVVNDWLVEHREEAFAPGATPTVEDVNARFHPYIQRRSRPTDKNEQTSLFGVRVELRELQENVEIALLTDSGTPKWDTDIEMPRTVAQGAEFVRAYFKSGVRYLGPLRDEPRPVYPLEVLENTTDVGYRGEHTAAVLELNANTKVSYVPAASFHAGSPQFKQEYAPLKAAVIDWLGYMGVADDVLAREEGVFGNRLQVTTPGLDKFHDLTNVGVGVS